MQIFRIAGILLLVGIGVHAESDPDHVEASLSWESETRAILEAMAKDLTETLKPWPVPDRIFDVTQYGAVGDGETLNTESIQRAINACSASGGGVVLFDGGDFVTGTIDLKSGVMLEVNEGARILGSTDLKDYPDRVPKRLTVMDTHMDMRQSLIYAEGVTNIGLRGQGMIDFRGTQENFPGKVTIGKTPGRPFGIRVIDSRNIVVQNITLKDAPCWMQNYLNCEDLIFQGMKVFNHSNWNNDGIDIDGCRRVIIRDCLISSEDDAMCIKGASLKPTEDLLIEDSTFVSTCNAFKIGTDTQGDFRRIYARNLVLGGIPLDMHTKRSHQASTGITLATVDGGDVEDILIRDITINRARAPIYLQVGKRGRLMPGMPKAPIGTFHRVIIENVTGKENFRQGSLISGIKEGLVEDVILRNIDLEMQGGGTEEMAAADVKYETRGYPDAQRYSRNGLPSFGFYIRHARNLHFENIKVTPSRPDARPMFVNGGDLEHVYLDNQPLPFQASSSGTDENGSSL